MNDPDQTPLSTIKRAGWTSPGANPTIDFREEGRAYVQAMAPAFVLAASGHGEFVRPGRTQADDILQGVMNDADSAEDLRDFLEGAAHHVTRSLIGLIERSLVRPDM